MTDLSAEELEALRRVHQAISKQPAPFVIVGGWSARLLRRHPLAKPPGYPSLQTEDLDVAAPDRIPGGGDALAQAIKAQGFQPELSGEERPPITRYRLDSPPGFELEFIAPLHGGATRRDGTADATVDLLGVSAQKLRHVEVLLIEPCPIAMPELGPDASLLVVNPASFIIQRLLIVRERKTPAKAGKDVLYIYDALQLFTHAGRIHPDVVALAQRVMASLRPKQAQLLKETIARVSDPSERAVLEAAQIARATRPSPPAPQALALACRLGLAELIEARFVFPSVPTAPKLDRVTILPAVNSDAVRTHLADALEADLVGPFNRKPGEVWSAAGEVLGIAPSRWYLTGFLAPRLQREPDDDPTEEDDEPGAGDDVDDTEAGAPDPAVKRKHRLAASMGMSVLVKKQTQKLTASITWADYLPTETEGDPENPRKRKRPVWTRAFRGPIELEVRLDRPAELKKGYEIPGSNGLWIQGQLEPAHDGLRAVSIFVVNGRQPLTAAAARDEAYAFQVRLELHSADGFAGRPNRSDELVKDPDERIGDLLYRDREEFAVGHGVSIYVPSERPVVRLATAWLPRAEVQRVIQREIGGVTVLMDELAQLPDGAAMAKALEPLVGAYSGWIKEQASREVGGNERKQTRDHLVSEANHARDRIGEGIALLQTNPTALRAFQLMNRAMADAARRARPLDPPSWRLFQLAFVLLNLPSISDPKHPDRKLVELIFFPTGGGKTEAYLGLIGFTLLLRRLEGKDRPDQGLGVAVLLRYTLRLLTLDQLGRAATLICALDRLRIQHPELGQVRFAIGLWVGRSATANTLAEVSKQITEYKNNTSPRAQSPFPLTHCPWCAAELGREGFVLRPNKTHPTEVLVGCGNFECPYSLGKNPQGLPVLFVDEQIYRELPCFLVATVDKFALLPWRGETGMLFGRVLARDGLRFFGPCDGPDDLKFASQQLPSGVLPPELIVQDELHLISGPLGSMVGLYEAAVLTLCPDAKILASTATVRRAVQQIQRLYGRQLAVFPPPGVDASETFFARVDTSQGARRYLGVAAPGRPMKTILLRVYISLLASAWRQHDGTADGQSGADPYLTLVGYFNSLRELGGMRRLVEDEVRKLTLGREERRPLDFPAEEPHPWYRNHTLRSEPVELTSREKTRDIRDSKTRLSRPHGDKTAVDVLLASNMISVGVDIDRLGLMVIAGQPKTASEYIQASSRVGRNPKKAGLVVTCLNVAKPRDRSHYERFSCWHESFYRFVEPTSVTPFSGPALDRGLPGVVLALGRLFSTAMTAPGSVMKLAEHRTQLEALLERVAERAGGEPGMSEEQRKRAHEEVFRRIKNLLDAWARIVKRAQEDATPRAYSKLDPGAKGKGLLHTALDSDDTFDDDEKKFRAPLSMRDVEASVHLWISRLPLGGFKAVRAKEPADGKS